MADTHVTPDNHIDHDVDHDHGAQRWWRGQSIAEHDHYDPDHYDPDP